MISDEELAAVAAAMQSLTQGAAPETQAVQSRWKLAARHPGLDLEDLRAL